MGADPAKNDWELRFGNTRRRTDHELLAEAERALDDPQDDPDSRFASKATRTPKTPDRPSTLDRFARLTIARAFGRPLA
jgi:hypothetical protein